MIVNCTLKKISNASSFVEIILNPEKKGGKISQQVQGKVLDLERKFQFQAVLFESTENTVNKRTPTCMQFKRALQYRTDFKETAPIALYLNSSF